MTELEPLSVYEPLDDAKRLKIAQHDYKRFLNASDGMGNSNSQSSPVAADKAKYILIGVEKLLRDTGNPLSALDPAGKKTNEDIQREIDEKLKPITNDQRRHSRIAPSGTSAGREL